MNIKQAMNQVIAYAHSLRAHNTARSYGNGLNVFASSLINKGLKLNEPIEKLNMEHFINFPLWLAEHGYSKKTMNVYASGVKFFLDWLVIGNLIQPTYQETLRWHKAISQIFRKREDRLPRMPQNGAVEKLKAAVRELDEPSPRYERNIALIEILASTGCRNAEIAGLKIKDIDLNERIATVTGKGNKERIVFFSKEAENAIRCYWLVRGFTEKTHPVFARHDKAIGKKKIGSLTTASIRDIVDAVVSKAGLEKGSFTPHYFRHAFGIKMLRETGNLALVQDLLGHSSPNATRVYAKVLYEDLRAAHREVYG